MKNENKERLREQLAQYGYVLSVPEASMAAPEKVLEALLKQDDVRLLEGFPVVLANAFSKKSALSWEGKAWFPRKAFSAKVQERWVALMAMCFLLFRLFGLEKVSQDRALQLLKKSPEGEKVLAGLGKDFSCEEAEVNGLRLSTDRLKTSFRNYVVHQPESGKELEEQKNALELELLLSAFFTVRQKELLKKRVAGKPMTKTEQEYYSRVVKKRLRALADTRLHQMARSLVYS